MSQPASYPQPDTLGSDESTITAVATMPVPRPWYGFPPAHSVAESIAIAMARIVAQTVTQRANGSSR